MDSIDRSFTELIRNAFADYLDRRRAHDEGRCGESSAFFSRLPAVGWLTAEEAATYLGLSSRMALYQAVRRGQLPVHHIGRRLRFKRSELDEWVAKGKRR